MTLAELGTGSGAVEVTPDQVATVAADVWGSFLDLELVADPRGEDALPFPGRTTTGCVSVSGAWEGSVFLQCPADHARIAAEAMFAAAPGSLSADEVGDALGELTNMVGGNLKSLLPAPSALSIPSVAEGESCTVRVPGAVLISSVVLVCAAGPVAISVWRV
jgi:chemotaxis protein CheX